ncbi:hypothetical protein N7450_009361 [Penicillium hetheringtonii]|uniref:Uncharacterized protein n=1 Tax=Penicillium hetheringtonii TaxID=911720 RepID=A0AAD6DEX4_9EURO|nr:hypothetical protein N7450_009361 [Penicillium hetheringtonii]
MAIIGSRSRSSGTCGGPKRRASDPELDIDFGVDMEEAPEGAAKGEKSWEEEELRCPLGG